MNAGTVHKPAGTNRVFLADTDFLNGGQVLVDAGTLAFHGYSGEGTLEILEGATAALAGPTTPGDSAVIAGPGNLEFGYQDGNRTLWASAVIGATYEVTGQTTVGPGSVEFLRAIDLPESPLRVGGLVRFGSSARWHTVEIVPGHERTVRFDGPAEINRLICNLGTLAGTGPMSVTERLFCDRTTLLEGGTLQVAGDVTIARNLNLSRTLHLLPGSNLDLDPVGASLTAIAPAANQALGRIVNEGTFTKTGTDRTDLQVNFDNRGLLRITQGTARLTQASNPQLLQLAGATLHLEGGALEFFDATQLNLGEGTVSGVGTLRQYQPFVFSAVRNNAVIQPGDPAGTLRIEGANYQQRPTGELRILLTADGHGRLEVAQDLELGGRLRVELEPAFVPPAGSSFEIASGSRRIGEFAEVLLPADAPGRTWSLEYGATGVAVRLDP